MSILDHLSVRLWWSGRTGVARSRDVVMTLVAPPVLPFDFAELDFSPGACMLVRRAATEPMNDMHKDEIQACWAYLSKLDSVPDVEGDC